MLSQQLLSMASQSTEEVARRFSHRQGLERSVEVVRALEPQQGFFQVPPSPDLWLGTKSQTIQKKQNITAFRKIKKGI